MSSFYEFLVIKDGHHYLSTSNRTGRSLTALEAKAMMNDLALRFPASEGFEVTCTYWSCIGTSVEA